MVDRFTVSNITSETRSCISLVLVLVRNAKRLIFPTPSLLLLVNTPTTRINKQTNASTSLSITDQILVIIVCFLS